MAIALFGSLTGGLYWARRRCRALSASENANFPDSTRRSPLLSC
jgi:hypothetical protein